MKQSRKSAASRTEVTKYDGSNERLNALLTGETVWIVQGSVGRKPIIADTAEEAKEDYLFRFYIQKEPVEDEFGSEDVDL